MGRDKVEEKAQKERDKAARASQDAYQEAIGKGDPTGEELPARPDGTEVTPEEMPANGVWAGSSGVLREQEAPGQEATDETTGEAAELEGADGEFPKVVGGGWYELSDGNRVQGQEAADDAQKALA